MEGDETSRSGVRFLLWLAGAAVILAVFHTVLAVVWGPGPIIAELPWYVPMMHSFLALAALSIAFLGFGRYQVIREPTPFWIGVAFSTFAVLAMFYVLSWPGLLPDERGLIAQLPNSSSWLWHLKFTALAVLLLLAVIAPWPRVGAIAEGWWLPLVVGWMLLVFAVGWVSVVYEEWLPALVADGAFTPLNIGWNYGIALAFAIGFLLSIRCYRDAGDSLVGYMAMAQLVLVFCIATSIIGGRRYDLWWYWQRVLGVTGFVVILFGLLSEYVQLYRRERQRARELETLQQVTDPFLAREGLELLLQGLLQRAVAIMGANAGSISVLDPDRRELVLTKGLGIPRRYVGLRMRLGEGPSGQAAQLGAVVSVRDAQADATSQTPYIRDRRLRGVIAAPMRVGSEVIGAVQVDFLAPRKFTRYEERLLEVVAERAALAIHQARLLERVQEERNRLQVLIDTAPVGIVFHVAPDGRIVVFNKAAELLMGQPANFQLDLAGQVDFYQIYRPTGEPFPPEDLPAGRALRGKVSSGIELVVRHPSGRQVHLLANSAPLKDASGRVVGAIVAFQDITSLKEQERLRDEFISTAAHELKTPVTTIKGYAQMMRKWAPGGHEPREGRAIEVINAQADRISRRVQEMLEAVRFRMAPPELHRARFDLGELAGEVVERLQAMTRAHQLLLHREGPVPVDADRERIEEVLVSLVDNAIKFSPQGGEIEVRVRRQAGEAVVSVRDHGVGIPKERQPHIFEPFYEAVPPGAPGYRGVVALSLYLSRLAIERHGGRIWFESEEGKGSVFHLSLPLAEGGQNESQG